MALRDQPYLPLYVQDYLTDEKLNMCSAATQGIYIKMMCVFHKSEKYGGILLKQKDKQNIKQNDKQNLSTCFLFANKFAKLLPFTLHEIENAIFELLEENVIQIDGDFIFQKRMVNDNKLSEIRSLAGKKGGQKSQSKPKKNKDFATDFAKAKSEANTEYEYEYENVNENKDEIKKRGVGKNKITMPFESENFAKIWQNWKEYKSKEFGFKFKSEQSEQSQLMSLTKIADANEEKAIKIIMQSMENGWKGFFELKTNHTNGNSKSNGNRSIEERLQSTFDLVDRMYGQ
jgi:hypothetical protein